MMKALFLNESRRRELMIPWFHHASSFLCTTGRITVSLLLVMMGTQELKAQTLDKGHQIILNRGIQLQGLVITYDVFHLSTFQAGNFTTLHWNWDSVPSWMGAAPGLQWGRWARCQAEMPPMGAGVARSCPGGSGTTTESEVPYASNLVFAQIGDEQNLNDTTVRADTATWFNAVRASYPNTILYCNSYGGQLTNASLDAFINTSHPDMLSFDTYPFRPGEPTGGSPVHLYGDMQRYRKFALSYGLPYAMYTQTYHSTTEGIRDPSESELRVEYFAGLAFGYTAFNCFVYNMGASSLFTGGGDNIPTPLYASLTEIHRRVKLLGPSMIRLLNTDVRFINGQYKDASNNTMTNPTPIDVLNWQVNVNDPYLRGWVVTNTGTKNNGLPGDVWLAWFKALDESYDGPNYTGETYMMVVNGLTDPTGTAANCHQQVKLNWAFADGITNVQRVRQDNGQIEVVDCPIIPNSGGRRQLTLELDGGTGDLFKFNDTANFIGIEPVDLTPPGPVTSFTATPQTGAVMLAWHNPAASDFSATLIRRKTGSFPTDRDDGQLVVDQSNAPNSLDSYQDTGLVAGTTYYYAAFAHDIHRNYSMAANASATVPIVDATPPGPVTLFTATGKPAAILLSWHNPSDPDFSGTLIRRKIGSYPTGIADGMQVANRTAAPGSNDSFTDSGLNYGTKYYYAAFAYDAQPNYAAAAQANASPVSNGDFDLDGDTDQSDFAFFQRCYSGFGVLYAAGCEAEDFTLDGTIDSSDLSAFLNCLNGADKPPGC